MLIELSFTFILIKAQVDDDNDSDNLHQSSIDSE